MKVMGRTGCAISLFGLILAQNSYAIAAKCEDQNVVAALTERIKCKSMINCANMGFKSSKALEQASDAEIEAVFAEQKRLKTPTTNDPKRAEFYNKVMLLRRHSMFGYRELFKSFQMTTATLDYNPITRRYSCEARISMDPELMEAAFVFGTFFGVYEGENAAITDQQIANGQDPWPRLDEGVSILMGYFKRCISPTRRFALQPTDTKTLIVMSPGYFRPGCMPHPTLNETDSFPVE